MNITFPPHVVDFLHSKGFDGLPEHWPFQATVLSEHRVFLLFGQHVSYVLDGNNWTFSSMGRAASTVADKNALGGRGMNLENIKGIGRIVWLFPDGSLQWDNADGTMEVAEVSNGSTWTTLDAWCNVLTRKEKSLLVRFLGQRQLYAVIRASLQAWSSQLKASMEPEVQGLSGSRHRHTE